MSEVTLPTDKKFRNLTGMTFNNWSVIRYLGKSKKSHSWLCRCSCGTEKNVFACNLTRGLSKSCGCQRATGVDHCNFVDLIGKEFGRLTVVEMTDQRHLGGIMWRCRCVCGGEKLVRTVDLNRSTVRSCGCLEKEARVVSKMTHGKTGTPEYDIWSGIKTRCTNPNVECYGNYGGRGISMFPEWVDSFEKFLEYVGPRPSEKHSIDRYPNQDGNYEPGNVRWATQKEQARNMRSNRMLEFRGESKCLIEWCEILGLRSSMVLNRLNMYGWSVERALSTPSMNKNGRRKKNV